MLGQPCTQRPTGAPPWVMGSDFDPAVSGRNNPPWRAVVSPLQGLNSSRPSNPRRRFAAFAATLCSGLICRCPFGAFRRCPSKPRRQIRIHRDHDATQPSPVPHALKGQPQTSPGHSDRRERRPGSRSPSRPQPCKGETTRRGTTLCRLFRAWAPLVFKPSAALRGSRRYALPWADLSLPLRGDSDMVSETPAVRSASTETIT